MLIDAHTHIFPDRFIGERERMLASEPVFAELYASPRARMATVDHLLRAMDEASVDHAVIAGFAWRDPDRCRRHNDFLLQAVAGSCGRLSAFCCVPLGAPGDATHEIERCAAAGARGLGELRMQTPGVDLAVDPVGHAIAEVAAGLALPLLIHASEPVGHTYAGKTGGPLSGIWTYLTAHPGLTAILAHLGGGLPFYAHMPEVRTLFERTFVDTAASPWLYDRLVYRTVVDLIGAGRLLFGSDYPLRHPAQDIAVLENASLTDDERAMVLGGNAARLLSLEPRP